MTRQKHFKRRVRERMQKTGESYTTARSHLLTLASAAARPAVGDLRQAHQNVRPASQVAQPGTSRIGPVRLRGGRWSVRRPGLPRLRELAIAYAMVISIAIGAAGFVTFFASQAPQSSPLQVAGAQP